MKHETVTFQRGHDDAGRPTYAARCETCGAATFGGAPTAAAAREALRHDDDDAPAAGSASGGNVTFAVFPWLTVEIPAAALDGLSADEVEAVRAAGRAEVVRWLRLRGRLEAPAS